MMKRELQGGWRGAWAQVPTRASVLVGAVATAMEFFGVLPPDLYPPTLLLVLTLIATTILVERYVLIATLLRKTDTGFTDVSSKLDQMREASGQIEVRVFESAREALDYIANLISEAQSTIEHAALAPSVSRLPREQGSYESAIRKAARSSSVEYRYLADLPDSHRSERISKLRADPKVERFYVRDSIIGETSPRFHNFMVFDKKKVVVNFPHEEGKPGRFLVIQNSSMVSFYVDLFESLWAGGRRIDMKTALGGAE